MKTTRYIILFVVSVLSSCTISDKKQVQEKVITMIDSPSKSISAEPYLFTDIDGDTYLSWIEEGERKFHLKFSRIEDGNWTEPREIVSGNNWFVNWADYPMIVSNGRQLMAHYLATSGDGAYAYNVMLSTSQDDGISWSKPEILHDDGRLAEHGFVSFLPFQDHFLVAWLDGRNTVNEGEQHMHPNGQMSMRAAIIDKNGAKLDEWELDSRTCDCCQTTAALTDNGPVVVYRDRSDEEIRDISIVRYVNGQWTEPRSVYSDHWKIAGCPVNGPRADAIGNNLAIAWFSSPDADARVQVIFSSDGGATFGDPIRIDEGKGIGRVDVVMLDEDNAMVSWMEGPDIKVVKVSSNKTKESTITIASSSDERSSGFPQMTKSGNKLIFAWTDDMHKNIRTASMMIDRK